MCGTQIWKLKRKSKAAKKNTGGKCFLNRVLTKGQQINPVTKPSKQLQPYRTDRSSLPVTARGFLGCTARAQSSPSQWPCMISMGLSLSLTSTSKISLSWVPARSLSAFQHTLRMESPGGTAGLLSVPAVLGTAQHCWETHRAFPAGNWALGAHTTSQLIQNSRHLWQIFFIWHTKRENMLPAHLGNLKTSSVSQDLTIWILY